LIYYYDRGDRIDGADEIIGKENDNNGNIGNEADRIGKI
jgi:hypothetical protein